MLSHIGANAQNGPKLLLKQHYKMSYFKKDYIVGIEAKGEGKYDLYINAEPLFVDHSDEMGIIVEHADIPAFLSYLRSVRNKYVNWIKVAHSNKVRSYSKEIPSRLLSLSGVLFLSTWQSDASVVYCR